VPKLSRRSVLAAAAAGAATIAAERLEARAVTEGSPAPRSAKPAGRPNILIIKSDQHNARCLGVNGHKQVKTPNLDELARGGVNFTRAFVQNPICTPSRMCYLTGQYPHNHGLYGLSDGGGFFSKSLPSMFSEFKKLGYRTGVVGHIHVEDEWLQPHCDQYRNMYTRNDPYSEYLKAKGLLDKRDDIALKGVSQTVDACASELSFEDSCEGYVLKSFLEFLKDLPDNQPFLYQMDPLHPHECWIPVKEFWDLYEGVELELPPSADEDLSGKPPNQADTVNRFRNYPWLFEPKTYEAGRMRKLRGYYGCISQVDHLVGLARKKLREIGREGNTIIVYCSDHGDFALEHGILEKAPGISYDAILRTPMIWYWPSGGFSAGSTVEELIESVDLFPSLCSLMGVEVPDTVDGVDISAMLRGDTKPVRDFVVAEFALSRTIRTKEWKLCHRPRGMLGDKKDWGELYHVSEDPWEMKNLYDDPESAAIREDLRRTLFDWTQLTTRCGSVLSSGPHGVDGKVTVAALRRMIEKGSQNYL